MRAPDGKLRHFAYLDEVAIRVPKERPDFAAPVNGRGQKLGTPAHERFVCRAAVGHPQSQLMADAVRMGMSRALLKFNGGSVHDYATIADDSPRPSRASRARRAATSAGIS